MSEVEAKPEKRKPGRPKGTGGTPGYRKILARLEADFPGYHPVQSMAEGAIALSEQARQDPEKWPAAVEAHDRVAKYIMPRLRTVKITGDDDAPLVVNLSSLQAAI